MKLKFVVAIFAIAALPVCAHAQQKGAPKVTKADAQKVIQIVTGDKAKAKIYCDIAALGEAMDQAEQKKDEKKMEALSAQADEMGKKIGPEYVALMDGMQEMEPDSKESQEIGTMLEALDKLCAK